MTERFGTCIMPIAQEIKKIAAVFPHIAVPARQRNCRRTSQQESQVTQLGNHACAIPAGMEKYKPNGNKKASKQLKQPKA